MPKKAATSPVALSRDPRTIAVARKYVWWQPPERAIDDARTLLAQVMTLGVLEDVRWLLDSVSQESLRQVLGDPPIGVFNGRSWHFWHLRLGCKPVPPLPKRPLPP